MCFRRQSRKGKIMTKELANEHKSRLLKNSLAFGFAA
jgi:hypothetical protein